MFSAKVTACRCKFVRGTGPEEKPAKEQEKVGWAAQTLLLGPTDGTAYQGLSLGSESVSDSFAKSARLGPRAVRSTDLVGLVARNCLNEDTFSATTVPPSPRADPASPSCALCGAVWSWGAGPSWRMRCPSLPIVSAVTADDVERMGGWGLDASTAPVAFSCHDCQLCQLFPNSVVEYSLSNLGCLLGEALPSAPSCHRDGGPDACEDWPRFTRGPECAATGASNGCPPK